MAEAVLEIMLENLSSLFQKELGLFFGVDQEMQRLSSILTTIKAVLEDAEEKQLTNRSLNNWVRKLKDAAHLLDDILDECATEALGLEYQQRQEYCCSANKVQGSCLSSFVHPKHVLFRYNIAKKMKWIRERLDEIAEERIKFHLCETIHERRTNYQVMEWRQTTSIITQPQIYGREEDKEKIVDFLVGHASGFEDLSIYPIVGIGGLGKTTLAQLVFNDERVVNHFEQRIWVCVSEDFSLKRMSKTIIELASEHKCEDLDIELLQRKVQELFRGKRYLIVLDDVWNDNQEKWDKLKYVLTCGSKGASIVVTTRLAKVASIMGTMPPHQLLMLSEDDCWELFKQRALGQEDEEYAKLVTIGKEIVKKCKGVPLAAKALGSLLRFKREEKDWICVMESQIWSLPEDEYSILPALRLSYLNLSAKLRQCFAYCALFPKDHVMSKKFVIELWIANGFISSNEKLEALEDDGNVVWNELYWRSFFQDIKTDEFDTYFKMHDLVHDLAQSIMEEECCFITENNGRTSLSKRTQHLLYDGSLSLDLHQVKSLKTCIWRRGSFCVNDSPHFLMKCFSLRVLDVQHLKQVSSSIGNLIHLRYLNLSWGNFKALPNSITRLWNLQVLNLNYCQELQKLPNGLKCLKALQHLYMDHCRSLSRMAPELGQLTCLKTLNIYIVDKQRGFLLAELGLLKLKGKLHIKHLERVKSVMDAEEANLAGKHLDNLLLSWGRNEESSLQENVEEILKLLQPQTKPLKTLGVGGYMGVQFPRWMGDPTLEDLSYIELVDCKNCLSLPSLCNLPSLKTLKISNMNHLQFLDDDKPYDGGLTRCFKALQFLVLDKLPSLVKLSKEDGENMFPCLSKLQVDHCPNLLSLPCLPSMVELRLIDDCNQALLATIFQSLHNLESFWLLDNKGLASLPNGMVQQGLTCLKELHICRYDKLEALPTEISFNTLEELHIENCEKLEPLTEQVLHRLHSLKRLTIGWYPKFKLSSNFQFLTSLESLQIGSCPEVYDFPEALQHITALQSLTLYDLPNLASFPDWLGSLENLNSLYISHCPKLNALPMSIQCLRNLKNLHIYACPELEKRYAKETGEDWHKIAHIPRIFMWSRVIVPGGFRGSFYGVNDTEV